MTFDKIPYFMENPEWYFFDQKEWKYMLTEKAPKEARDSYKEFYKTLQSDAVKVIPQKRRKS